MIKRKTVFEQVPLATARRVAAEELKQKEASRKNSGSKRKTDGPPETTIAGAERATL
jgi:hypothetical protein